MLPYSDSWNAPANKKGVDYCQVIAQEYLREVIVGNIQAPTCDAPPAYNPPIFGPPEAPKDWSCANPSADPQCR